MNDVKNQIDKKTTMDMIEKIIEDGNEPRSIREIQKKYELSFPFHVQLVRKHGSAPVSSGEIMYVPGYTNQLISNKVREVVTGLIYPGGDGTTWYVPTDCPSYILAQEP